MEELIRINDNVRRILMKHTKKSTAAECLNEILKNDLTRKLKKYKIMLKHFEEKYKLDFNAFETSHKNTDMEFEMEKDYFDWDLAVQRSEEALKLLEYRMFSSIEDAILQIEEIYQDYQFVLKDIFFHNFFPASPIFFPRSATAYWLENSIINILFQKY